MDRYEIYSKDMFKEFKKSQEGKNFIKFEKNKNENIVASTLRC